MTQSHAAVVGNSVAAMMASLSLSASGWRVTLITPSPRLGAHFAGVSTDGHLFDAGMVFLEFTSFNADASASLSTYDPAVRNDAGRFVQVVARTLARFGAWREAPAPVMFLDGAVTPDLIITNRLEGLMTLPVSVRQRMMAELTTLVEGSNRELHASRKAHSRAFDLASFERVSLANHGPTLHEQFIEPLSLKLAGVPATMLLGRYHRVAWLPLYYPESLLAALRGEALPWEPTVFSSPHDGTVAAMIQRMGAEVVSAPGVNVVHARVTALRGTGTSYDLSLDADRQVVADRLVWGADPEHLVGLCGASAAPPMRRASLVLAFALVHREKLLRRDSTMLVPRDSALPFRVTNQSAAAGLDEPLCRIVVEWNADYAATVLSDGRAAVADALMRLGIIGEETALASVMVKSFPGALPLPTTDNLQRAAAIGAALDTELPGVPRIGPAAPFGATSLNDQILQGLKCALDFGEPS